MRIAVLGRTRMLLDAAEKLESAGHHVVFVGTMKPAEFYDAGYEHFSCFADRVGAAYRQGGDINSPEYIDILKQSGAEIGISVNWPTIIGRSTISVLPKGILNAHAGDLPRYRGNACPNWAIINGEDRIGACVHFMDPDELDSGPVLVREHFPLEPDSYIGDVYRWLHDIIPVMFHKAVSGLENNTLVSAPQAKDPALSLRCYPRRPEDSRIDWNKSVAEIHRLIRASSQPFSGAFSFLEGSQRVVILRARPFSHPGPFMAVPGQVLFRHQNQPVIACADGCLWLEEFTVDGVAEADATNNQGLFGSRSRLV